MAESDPIKSTDLVQDNVFDNTIKSAQALERELSNLVVGFEGIIKANAEFLNQNKDPKTSSQVRDVSKALKEQELARKALLETERVAEKLKQEELKTEKQRISLSKAQSSELKKQQKELELLNSEYKKGTQRLSELKKELKELSFAGKQNTEEFKKLSKEFVDLDAKVRKAEEGVGEFIRNVGNYPQQLKALQKALTDLEPGTDEFNRLAKEAGEVKDKMNDAKEATKAFASGAKLTQAKNIFGQIGTDLADLDFQGAAEKAKTFAGVIKSVSFAEVVKGIKDFGLAIVNVGKALLLNPFVLIASGIAAITYLIYDQIQAEKELAEERRKAHEEKMAALKSELLARQDYEEELRKAQGGTPEEIYQKERKAILDRIALNRFFIKNKIIHAQEYYDTDKKLFDDLILLEVKRNAAREEENKKLNEEARKAAAERKKIAEEANRKILDSYDEYIKEAEKKYKQDTDNFLKSWQDRLEKERQARKERGELINDNLVLEAELNEDLVAQENARYSREIENLKVFYDDKGELDSEYLKERELLQRRHQKNLDKIEDEADKKRINANIDRINQLISSLQQQIDAANAAEERGIDNSIQQRERQIERQTELAKQGLDNQLAYEDQKLAKDQLKKKELQEKAAREQELIQLSQAYLSAFQAELNKPGGNPSTAANRALADVLIARGIAKGLVQFFAEGTDYVHGPGTETSDSVPAMLSVAEAVIPAKENKKNRKAVKSLVDGTFNDMFMPKFEMKQQGSFAENAYASILIQQNNEMKEILKDIANKPAQRVDVDGFGNLIERVYNKGREDVITHKQKPKIV